MYGPGYSASDRYLGPAFVDAAITGQRFVIPQASSSQVLRLYVSVANLPGGDAVIHLFRNNVDVDAGWSIANGELGPWMAFWNTSFVAGDTIALRLVEDDTPGEIAFSGILYCT